MNCLYIWAKLGLDNRRTCQKTAFIINFPYVLVIVMYFSDCVYLGFISMQVQSFIIIKLFKIYANIIIFNVIHF